ncbi:MAG: DNRLRE domain-containing protein [Planctomycetota bacterium]
MGELLQTGVCAAAVMATATSAGQTTVTLNATAEATIFEDGSAIGVGQVFAGRSGNGQTRRGLVQFDLSALPQGNVISATLSALVINQRGAATLNAHRLLQAWNEGPSAGGGSAGGIGVTSTPDDVTWTGTGLGGSWTNVGGDFEAVATDTQNATGSGNAVEFDVSSDVSLFADGLADNFGWIIISDFELLPRNVVGISTDEDGSIPITLTVTVAEAEPCLADVNGDGELTPADFNAWVLAFNNQAPECDQNGDTLCNPGDFNAWVLNFNAGCP